MPSLDLPTGKSVIDIVVPRDAFAHGRTDVSVALQARLANGQPLPDWLKFDALTGRFSGEVPSDFAGEINIRLIAIDSAGSRVETTFRIRVLDLNREKVSMKGKPSLREQLSLAGHAMRLGERDMLLDKLRHGHADRSGSMIVSRLLVASRTGKA